MKRIVLTACGHLHVFKYFEQSVLLYGAKLPNFIYKKIQNSKFHIGGHKHDIVSQKEDKLFVGYYIVIYSWRMSKTKAAKYIFDSKLIIENKNSLSSFSYSSSTVFTKIFKK